MISRQNLNVTKIVNKRTINLKNKTILSRVEKNCVEHEVSQYPTIFENIKAYTTMYTRQ